MPDTCWCKHVKDTHKVEVRSGKVWLGECMSCSCAKFAETRPLLVLPPKTPAAGAPETAPEPWYGGNRCPHAKAEDGLCWVPDCPEGPDSRVVPERVEGPAPAAGWPYEHFRTFNADGSERPSWPLGSWDSWWCPECGARTFEQRECCGSPMRPVRVEIHTREVSDG
jgi:hypothetical protein